MPAMHVESLYLLAGLLVAGVAAQWCASRLRIPAIVLLLGTGLLAGPILGLVNPSELFGDLLSPLVSLGVAVILFEGGLSLKWSEARKLGWPLWLMVTGGLVITFGATTWLGHTLAGLSWPTAAVAGAILVVTGPTVIKPMLRYARLSQRPARLLKWESIVNDPLGALLAVAVLEFVLLRSESGVEATPLGQIPWLILSAAVIGGASAWLLGHAMDRGWIVEHLKAPAILAGVVAVFAGSEALFHEAGLMAVTVMGVMLANVESPSVETVRHFKEDVTVLLVSLLFLILSANLTSDEIMAITGGDVALVAAVLLLVRPLAIWIPLHFTSVTWQEKALLGWVAPRGVVAAAMGAALAPRLVEAGVPDAARLVPLLFGVIMVTVLLNSFTLRPLARLLGIGAQGNGGLLLAGGASWGVDLARTLRRAGVEVTYVDEDDRSVRSARRLGIESWIGDVLDPELLDELPFERLSWLLAAAYDDRTNDLVCIGMRTTLGRERTLSVTSRDEETATRDMALQGRMPWGPAGTFPAIAARFWNGQRFAILEPEEEREDWDAFRAARPDALVLFAVTAGGGLSPVEDLDEAPLDARLVYIGPVSPGRSAPDAGSAPPAR